MGYVLIKYLLKIIPTNPTFYAIQNKKNLMKFFFQCAGFYIIFSIILIVLDQLLFEHVLSASILFGLVLGLIGSLIFGWFLETQIHHSQNFTSDKSVKE